MPSCSKSLLKASGGAPSKHGSIANMYTSEMCKLVDDGTAINNSAEECLSGERMALCHFDAASKLCLDQPLEFAIQLSSDVLSGTSYCLAKSNGSCQQMTDPDDETVTVGGTCGMADATQCELMCINTDCADTRFHMYNPANH